jgi:hypothetical protein
MSGWTVAGIIVVLYAVLMIVIAVRRTGVLWKITKAKLGGDRVKDETAVKILYVFSAVFGIAGIVFFVLGA